jgi:hypothetical protein
MQFEGKFLTVVLLAVFASFGVGFLWGIGDHRSTESIVSFTDAHIIFPTPTHDTARLIFSCKGSDRLMAYDLLNDEVLKNPRQIEKWMSSESNRVLKSDLFSHYTAYTAGASAIAFSLNGLHPVWLTPA